MSQYKFIGGDGETYGPYSRDEMQQFMAENRVNSQTQVSADDGAWQTAGQLPELASGDAPPGPAILGMPAAPNVHPPTIKPGKLQAMAIMTLVGGIIATISSIIWGIYAAITAIFTLGIGCICLIGPIYQMVAGILCIIQGSKLLGQNPDPYYAKTKKTAIMQIICIICFDVLNLTLGIISLVFLNDEEVKAYIRSKGGQI
jgi:hypothetical protein